MSFSFRRLMILAVLAVLMGGSLTLASGFHVYEQGAKASAQAVAFTARADDATANWYNPANIARFEQKQLSVGFSAVMLGDTTFESRMDEIDPSLFTGGTFDMVDNTPIVPHLHFVMPVGTVKGRPLVLGASITAPFGLITEWDLPFDGRFSGRKSDLETVVLNVNAAMDFGGGWAGALGLNYLDATLNEFSSHLTSLLVVGIPVEPMSNLTGSGSEIGWNAAVSWKNDEWAFGAVYRSEFEFDVEGNVTFTGVPPSLAPLFPNTEATGVLSLPSTLAFGGAYTGLKNWEFEADVHLINWSAFAELPIDFANPALADKVIEENWKDTVSYRFGGSYDLSEKHELRFGAYVETTAIPVETLRASIPDSDRVGYTAGYGFTGSRFSLDVYVMHIEPKSSTAGETAFLADDTIAVGTYETTIDLVGITGSFKF